MNIEVNLNKKDLVNLNLYYALHAKSNWISFVVVFLAIVIFLAINKGFYFSFIHSLVAFLCGLLGAFVATALGVLWNITTVLLASNSKNGVLGLHEYTIHENGLGEKTSANENLIKWSGIEEVTLLKNYILVRINIYLFHVIPRRSFANDEAFQGFYMRLNESVNKKA